jgi:hypothetical protein
MRNGAGFAAISADCANFRVLGEAEEIMEDFVSAWRSGVRQGLFAAPMGQTDVTRSPTPRFDLPEI